MCVRSDHILLPIYQKGLYMTLFPATVYYGFTGKYEHIDLAQVVDAQTPTRPSIGTNTVGQEWTDSGSGSGGTCENVKDARHFHISTPLDYYRFTPACYVIDSLKSAEKKRLSEAGNIDYQIFSYVSWT